MVFSPVPPEVKPVAHFMKLADEHESRNIVVAYWARMAACTMALRMTPNEKTPETARLIKELLDWLEKTKRENRDNEGITNDTAAQAIIEEYALKLFDHGDQQDRAQIFNKNTVKTFYTAGILFDVLEQFDLSEDLKEKQRYAKWKAAFIHNCLKNGEMPHPGSVQENEEHINSIVKITDLPEDERREAMAEKKRREQQRREEEEKNRPPPSDNGAGNVAGFNFNNFGGGVAGGSSARGSPTTPLIPQQPGYVTPAAPTTPIPNTAPATFQLPANSGSVSLTPDQIQKAQKYSKFATSALNYDDVAAAIDNLQKALNILQLGKD